MKRAWCGWVYILWDLYEVLFEWVCLLVVKGFQESFVLDNGLVNLVENFFIERDHCLNGKKGAVIASSLGMKSTS